VNDGFFARDLVPCEPSPGNLRTQQREAIRVLQRLSEPRPEGVVCGPCANINGVVFNSVDFGRGDERECRESAGRRRSTEAMEEDNCKIGFALNNPRFLPPADRIHAPAAS